MMNTIPPSSLINNREELDAFLNSPVALEMGQRFVEGFIPMMDAQIMQTVQSVVAEEFPKLADDDAFIQTVISRITPDVVTEQRFVFLAMNPKFPTAQ